MNTREHKQVIKRDPEWNNQYRLYFLMTFYVYSVGKMQVSIYEYAKHSLLLYYYLLIIALLSTQTTTKLHLLTLYMEKQTLAFKY